MPSSTEMAMIGPNSPQAPAPMKKRAESGVELAAVAQDRAAACRARWTSARWRRRGVSWILPVAVMTMASERGDDERDDPADGGQPAALSADGALLELHPGEEEQQAEAELGQQLDRVVDRIQPSTSGPKTTPAPSSSTTSATLMRNRPTISGTNGGDGRDDDERSELLGSFGDPPGGSTMRRLAVSSLGVPARAPSTACSSGFAARIVVT